MSTPGACIIIRNYRNIHRGKYPLAEAGKVILVRGDSGLGKTNLVHAIHYCLYGEKNPGDHNLAPNTSHTQVELVLGNGVILIRRTENKVESLEIFLEDGKKLHGPAAEQWVNTTYSSSEIWKQATHQGIRQPTPLMLTTGNEEKLCLLRTLAFGTSKSETLQVTLLIKQLTTEVATAKGRCEATLDPPQPALLRTETLEASRGLLAAIPVQPDVLAQHAKLRELTMYLSGKLEGMAPLQADAPQFNPEDSSHFEGGGSPVDEWKFLVKQLGELTENRQLSKVLKGDMGLLQEEMLELNPENGTVPASLDGLRTSVELHAEQNTLAEKLGLDSATLSAGAWQRTQQDLLVWNNHRHDLEQHIQRKLKVHSARADMHTIPPPPPEVAAHTVAVVYNDLVRTIEQLEQVDKTPSKTLLLRGFVVATLDKDRQTLAEHLGAEVWAKKRRIYDTLLSRRPKEVDLQRLEQFKVTLYELSLRAMKCPSCMAELHIKEGTLHRAAARRADVNEANLRSQIESAEKEHKNFLECKPLLEELKQITADSAYKESLVMTPQQLDNIRKSIYILEALLARSHSLDLSREARDWLLEHGETYLAQESQRATIQADDGHLQRDHQRLARLFGEDALDKAKSLADVHRIWWPIAGVRVTQPWMLDQPQEGAILPAYQERPAYGVADIKRLTRLQEVNAQITNTRARLDALMDNGVSLVLPNFPHYAYLEQSYFANITSVEDLNNALHQCQNILRKVEGMQEAYRAWVVDKALRESTGKLAQQLETARVEMDGLEETLARVNAANTTKAALVEHIDYLEKQAAFRASRDAAEEAAADLEASKGLLELAKIAECEVLEGKVEQLNACVNEFLQLFFTGEISLEISTTRVLKSNNDKKPHVNVKLTYKKHLYDSLDALSSGEHARVSIAIGAGFAKLSAFPFFIVDESLATLQADLRQHVVQVLRTELPQKRIVIILQDDNLNDFDQLIEFKGPPPEQ